MTTLTGGKTHRDPLPWLSETSSIRYRLEPDDGFGPYRFDPRPEFDNHNPILVELREDTATFGIHRAISDAEGAILFGEWRFDSTHEQRRHARRVLTKLAALTKEN